MQVAIVGSPQNTKHLKELGFKANAIGVSFKCFHTIDDFTSAATHGPFEKAFILTDIDNGMWMDVIRLVSTSHAIPLMHLILISANDSHDISINNNSDLLKKYQVNDIGNIAISHETFLSFLQKTPVLVRPNLENAEPQMASTQLSIKTIKNNYQKSLLNACKMVIDQTNLQKLSVQLSVKNTLNTDKATLRKQKIQIDHLIHSDPENYNYKFQLLSYYTALGDQEKSAEWFEKTTKELEKKSTVYWLGILGHLCVTQHCLEFASAVTLLLTQKNSNDGRWQASLLNAKIQLVLGNLTEAEIKLNEAILHNRHPNPEILNLKGIILKRDGDLQGAYDALLQAFELSDSDFRIAYNIGLNFEKMGQHSSALSWYKKSYEIYPAYRRAAAKIEIQS